MFIVENLEPQDKVANDKKVRDRVKIEDEILRLVFTGVLGKLQG